ncbi:hypothetical protein BZG36_01643 [Bifiguratus adelaidae]|uniref:Uncharacterized protein n=1 Tax=Bifiguratus adelaidae TaxID=1938954 RepID=A0A261Y4C0_9FUNG|nr:hypothetical protein BZG36_01643 [Bifiguratus adelaidae]
MPVIVSQDVNHRVYTPYSITKKYFGCIHLRAGGMISCFIWLALSSYFAVLGFLGVTPIYSFLDYTPRMVWASFNLFMALTGLLGIFLFFVNEPMQLKYFHKLVWCMVFLIVSDTFANVIVFVAGRQEYLVWCTEFSQSNMNDSIQIAYQNGTQVSLVFHTNGDYFHCSALWSTELKFGILSFVLILILYPYFAACIWAYAQKKVLLAIKAAELAADLIAGNPVAPVAVGGPGPAGPPPPGPPMLPPPGMMDPNFGAGNVFLISNLKPSDGGVWASLTGRNKKKNGAKRKPVKEKKQPEMTKQTHRASSGSTYAQDKHLLGQEHDPSVYRLSTASAGSYYPSEVVSPTQSKGFFGFKLGEDGTLIGLTQDQLDLEVNRATGRSPTVLTNGSGRNSSQFVRNGNIYENGDGIVVVSEP